MAERILRSYWLWGAVLLLGLLGILRQYLFAHSYWYDEAFLVLVVRQHGYGELLGAQPYNLVIPPAFLWAVRGMADLAGTGELALRFPALLAGVLGLVVMIPLSRTVVGGVHALWAFAWYAVCRHVVLHSCDVRPYTVDLLVSELAILSAALLVLPRGPRGWPWVALAALAVAGPWVSFPSVFALGGVSLGLAVALWRDNAPGRWRPWLAFNGLVLVSGLALWYFSARHMAYGGMQEHWGHAGWRGFPDWDRPLGLFYWLVTRPYEVANYGTRDLGVVMFVLAVVGGVALFRRSPALLVTLAAPLALAVGAALLGKYPLAHRTGVFYLPMLWLLAALGVRAVVAGGRRHGRQLALVGVLLVSWDLVHLVGQIAVPAGRLDYRGAYAYIHANQRPDDLVCAAPQVVYETYHGKDPAVLGEDQFGQVVEAVSVRRVWVVLGDNRADQRRRLEDAGGRVAHEKAVSGLRVLLLEPGRAATLAASPESQEATP